MLERAHTMKTSTIADAVGLALIAAVLTGCSATSLGATSSSDAPLGSSLVPFLPTTEAPVETTPPVVLDPVEQAQIGSGLTPEVYAEAAGKIGPAYMAADDKDSALAVTDAFGAEYGKPVVIVDYYRCSTNGVLAWGISGALFGTAPPGCGSGYAESREATLAKVEQRAKGMGWTSKDYILVFVDSVAGGF
jgi:hypothetical protein